jgi:hypothetical protein
MAARRSVIRSRQAKLENTLMPDVCWLIKAQRRFQEAMTPATTAPTVADSVTTDSSRLADTPFLTQVLKPGERPHQGSDLVSRRSDSSSMRSMHRAGGHECREYSRLYFRHEVAWHGPCVPGACWINCQLSRAHAMTVGSLRCPSPR